MKNETAQKLEDIYIQMLDTRIIEHLSIQLEIDERKAMDIYYQSTICQQIHEGLFDIQYLDYKYLAEDLIENELKRIK